MVLFINFPKYYKNTPKIFKKPSHPKFWIRSFLVNFCNYSKEEYIDDLIKTQVKKFIVHGLNILITGFKMTLALLPFYFLIYHFTGFLIPPLLNLIFFISYGVLWDMLETMHNIRVEGKIKANKAIRVKK